MTPLFQEQYYVTTKPRLSCCTLGPGSIGNCPRKDRQCQHIPFVDSPHHRGKGPIERSVVRERGMN